MPSSCAGTKTISFEQRARFWHSTSPLAWVHRGVFLRCSTPYHRRNRFKFLRGKLRPIVRPQPIGNTKQSNHGVLLWPIFTRMVVSNSDSLVLSFLPLIGTLRSNDADGNENVKKTIGLISKTATLHVHHAFWYISFLFLQDYDVKMPNLAFYGGRKQATTKFYFSFWAWIWSLEIQLQEGSPTFDKVKREE